MSESRELPLLLSEVHSNQSHVTTKYAFSTDNEDAGMDMAHTRVAMLSEQLHSFAPFGGSTVYFLALPSLSRDNLLRQTPKLRFRRFQTSLLARRIARKPINMYFLRNSTLKLRFRRFQTSLLARRIASKPTNMYFLWNSTLATLFSTQRGLTCSLKSTTLPHSRRLRRILHIVGNAPFAWLHLPVCKSVNDI
jgi:hypothetical protein